MDGVAPAFAGAKDTSTDRLRIAHITAPGGIGGLETVVATLARAQRAAGHAVTVFAVMEAEGQTPFFEALADADVSLRVIILSGRQYLAEFRALRAAVGAFGPTVVHTHGSRSDVVGYFVARALRCRVVSTSHGFTAIGLKQKLNEFIQRRVFRRFDTVVAVSTPMVKLLTGSGVAASRIVVIRNEVTVADPLSRDDARAALGLPRDGFVVGWVGRLSPEKGIHQFLDALGHCRDLPLTASVLGDGVEFASAQARIASDDLRGRVRLHGSTPSAARLLLAFDVLLLTSHTEGTPMVVLEALSVGVPVIATAVGGVPDLLAHDVGVLVPPGDVSALAAAIRRVCVSSVSTPVVRVAGASAVGDAVVQWMSLYESVYRGRPLPQSTDPHVVDHSKRYV